MPFVPWSQQAFSGVLRVGFHVIYVWQRGKKMENTWFGSGVLTLEGVCSIHKCFGWLNWIFLDLYKFCHIILSRTFV